MVSARHPSGTGQTNRASAPRAEVQADNPRIVAEITQAPVLGEVPVLSDPARGAEAFAPVGRAFLERWREA